MKQARFAELSSCSWIDWLLHPIGTTALDEICVDRVILNNFPRQTIAIVKAAFTDVPPGLSRELFIVSCEQVSDGLWWMCKNKFNLLQCASYVLLGGGELTVNSAVIIEGLCRRAEIECMKLCRSQGTGWQMPQQSQRSYNNKRN